MRRNDTALRAHSLADIQQDAGQEAVAKLLNECGGELSLLTGWLHRLAYAARDSNRRKRIATLELVRAEMEANGLSTAILPLREPQ